MTIFKEYQNYDGIGLAQLIKKKEVAVSDVLETAQSFLCNACGTELTVKLQSVVANEPPKHCKEEMTPIEY